MNNFSRIDVPSDVLVAIMKRLGLPPHTHILSPPLGTFGNIYLLGEGIALRVPHTTPLAIADVSTEAIIVPLACAAGVRAPALVLFDDTYEIR